MKWKLIFTDLDFLTRLKKHTIIQPLFVIAILLYCTPQLWATDLQVNTLEELLYFYPQKGEKQLLTFMQNNKQLSKDDKHKIDYLKGILAFKKSNPDTAITYLQNALLYFTHNNNLLYEVKTQLVLGSLVEKLGNYKQALQLYNNVVNVATENRELGYAYLGVARCECYLHGVIKKDENEILEKGIKLLKAIGKKEYDLYADYISLALTPTDKLHTKKMKDIASEYLKIDNKPRASSVYKSLSVIYLQKSQLDSSLYYVNKAIPLTNTVYPSVSLAPSLYQIKGYLSFLQKDYERAENYYKHSIVLNDSLNQTRGKHYVYNSLAKLDSVRGNLQSAKQHKILAQMSLELSKQDKYKYRLKVKDLSLQLSAMNLELNKHKFKTTALLVIIFGVAFFSLGLFALVYKKNKTTKEILKGQKKAMQLLLVQMGQSFCTDSLEPEEIKEIIDGVPQNQPTPYECFEQAFSDSIAAFKEKFPQLADGEIKYAVMIAIGLPNNVIAYIKQVNVSSVRKSKWRLRNKLELQKVDHLKPYFNQKVRIEVDTEALQQLIKYQVPKQENVSVAS